MNVKAALVKLLGEAIDLQLRFLTAREVQRSSQFRLLTIFQRTDRLQQLAAVDRWARRLAETGAGLPFDEVAFSVYSGNGEDGILLYLLHVLGAGGGAGKRRLVDIGASDGVAGNACNLIVNHGFEALLIDGSERLIRAGERFYSRAPLVFNNRPTFARSLVTKGNVAGTLRQHGFDGAIDVLSLDIDGNDLHVLEAADNVRPRIVVLEFNNIFGPDESMTVPYDEGAVQRFIDGYMYGGASLAAFAKLLGRRGYRLVGVDPSGQDAYFVDEACPSRYLPARSLDECFQASPYWQKNVKGAQGAAVRRAAWQEY